MPGRHRLLSSLLLSALLLAVGGVLMPPGASGVVVRHDRERSTLRDGAAGPDFAKVDQLMERLVGYGFAGVVLIAEGDEVHLANGYGLANRESKLEWSPDVVSDTGSITKQFTAAAILLMEEQGKLSVQDPITKHFADVPPDKQSVTLHHLLTHSSGIQDLPGRGDWDPVGREEVVRLLMEAPLAFEPGERYAYSNAGYTLLGVIIEQISGTPYEQHVRERLFLPLGMHDTGYILPEFEASRLAQGYRDGQRWGTTLERPMADDGPYWILRGNGGIHSTARDMHLWAQALMQGRVLAEESMKKLWTPHVREYDGETFYGYGWMVMDLPDGKRLVGHDGGNPAHVATFNMIPETGLILFAQCNVHADFPPTMRAFQSIMMHLTTGQPLPELPPAVRSLTPEQAAKYAGRYEIESGGGIEVSPERDGLKLEASGWDAWAALAPATDADVESFNRRSETVQGFMSAMVEGDYGPMYEAYEGRVPLERLQDGGEQRRRDDELRLGPITGIEVLGTAAFDEGHATIVRVEHEGGSVYRRYLWNEEGRMTGFHPLTALPAPLIYRPAGDGEMAALDARTLQARTVQFDQDERGRVALRVGDVTAVRVN